MFTQRLQLLLTVDQRRRLRAEAKRRKRSVASLVREAIDARFSTVSREEKIRAAREMRQMKGGKFLTPEEINRIVGEEREANFPLLFHRG